MFPSINIYGRTITTYLLLAIIGIFAAGICMCRLAKKRGEDDNEAIIVLLFMSIGVVLGGHLLYGIVNIRFFPLLFKADSFSQFLQYATVVFGGAVYYGGLIGGAIVAYITIRVRNLSLPVYADMIATIIPLFHSIARVGCFLGGCCYGVESHFGFTAHGNTLVPSVNDVQRFPVQLLEALLNLMLFFVLYRVYKKSLKKPSLQGKLLFIYLLSYSVIRFFDEFLRGDEARGFVFGMSTSQFISILLFALSLVVLLVMGIQERKETRT